MKCIKDYTNEELVERYRNTNSDIYFEKLLKKNNGIIKKTISRYKEYDKIKYSYDDYSQIGMIGVLKAIKNYDESKGYKFNTLLTQCITNELNNYIKPITRKYKNPNIKDDYIVVNIKGYVGDYNLTYEEIISYDNDNFSSVYESEDLIKTVSDRVLSILTPSQANVFKMLLNGLEVKEIASKLDVSNKNIYAHMKAIGKKFPHLRNEIVGQ